MKFLWTFYVLFTSKRARILHTQQSQTVNRIWAMWKLVYKVDDNTHHMFQSDEKNHDIKLLRYHISILCGVLLGENVSSYRRWIITKQVNAPLHCELAAHISSSHQIIWTVVHTHRGQYSLSTQVRVPRRSRHVYRRRKIQRNTVQHNTKNVSE